MNNQESKERRDKIADRLRAGDLPKVIEADFNVSQGFVSLVGREYRIPSAPKRRKQIALEMREDGKTQREISEKLGVGRSTVSKMLANQS